MPTLGRSHATRSILALALTLAVQPPASAALIGPCTIVINSNGTMTVNPTLNVLGSKQAGGIPATVTVNPQSLLCNILALLDCYSISVPSPANFLTAPGGAATNLTLSSVFTINGSGDIPGNTAVMVANGSKAVQIDLTATKSSGIFPAGTYQAQVTVRCE